MSTDRYVVSTIKYLTPGDEPPAMMLREPLPGEEKKKFTWDQRQVRVHDIRGHEKEFSLESDGFEVIDIDFDAPPQEDREAVEGAFYSTVRDRVKAELGASHVIAFDHNYRVPGARYDTVASKPAYFIHADYTDKSAPQRVRDLLPEDEAERRLAKRYAFINFWAPIKHPAEDLPLGVCRAASLDPQDFALCKMLWPGRDGEIYMFHHNPNHEWFYLSGMEPSQAYLFKCFDSDEGRPRYVPHTAFEDPNAQPGAKPRESVEVRTIAFFD